MMKSYFKCILFSVVALGIIHSPANALLLVQDNDPKAIIILSKEAYACPLEPVGNKNRKREPVDPISEEKRAALEIQFYVQRISSVTLQILPEGENINDLKPLYVGSAAGEQILDAVRRMSSDPASFSLEVTPQVASVRGLSPSGTFNGACELLEQLGVRWYLPGELGTVVPKLKTVVLKEQHTVEAPSFPSRYLQGVRADDWERHMRSGGPRFPSAHGIKLGRRADDLFKDHPEYFALRGGKRSKNQLCISHPVVLRMAVETTEQFFRGNPKADIIGMGANDGRGFCECESCKALDSGDWDPFGHCESMTDRYIWFFNQILKGIQDEFPEKRIGFYAYASYCRPPIKVKPDPRIVPAVAMITLCRMHGMDSPVCPEKSYEKWIIQEWGKLVPEVYYRGYWFNLADPGLPFFMIRRITREVPLGKRLGVAGWRTECMTNWAGNSPSLYIAYKLMWDHQADVDAILNDFCEKFFGPAAAPMHRFIDLMDRTVDEADYHTGSVWDIPVVYDSMVLSQAQQALKEASLLVPTGDIYGKRVWMYVKSFSFLKSFIEVMEGRIIHDYAKAWRSLKDMVTIREELAAEEPRLIPTKAEEYMNRFFAETIRQGYARTIEGNRFLAGLNDEWLFQIDPEQVGESLGWWIPDNRGGNWQKIKTCSRSWSDQGLRYYKGLAWYRQTVDLPALAEGTRVFLWFGAIDEAAKVWVDGKEIGISPKITFRPFELDATGAVKAGQPNVVVVCVSNKTLNELGTGGILGPVMFYLPADGNDAQLENSKPLGITFPEY